MKPAAAPHPRRRLALAAALSTAAIAAATLAPPTAPPAAATNHVTALIDLRTPSHGEPLPTWIAVDAANSRAYVSNSRAGTVTVIATTSHDIVDTIPLRSDGSNPGPASVALDLENDQLLVANFGSSSVSFVDIATGDVTRELTSATSPNVGPRPIGMAIDPGQNRAYVLNSSDETVSVIDTTTNEAIAKIPHDLRAGIGDEPKTIASDPTVNKTYVGNSDGSVSVIDTTADAVTTVIPASRLRGSPVSMAVSPVEGRMYMMNTAGVTIFDSASDAIVGYIDLRTFPLARVLSVDEEGNRLWVLTTRNQLVFDTTTSELLSTTDNATGPFRDNGATSLGMDPVHDQMFAVVTDKQTVAVVDLESVRGLVRQSGGDRFASAVRVSAAEFAPGVEAVYVASGENFPDALSGSAAAGAQGVPVLLVGKNSVPPGVGDEIARLKPKRIVVLGGPQAVSTEVETELGGYAPIARLTGADRFAVSAAVSRTNFPVGLPVAYVASGENFPDALSGGAAAAHGDAPVLLVSRNGVPVPVATELKRLKPGKIVVLGGENAVSSDVAAALREIAPTERITGADRFVVSAGISAATFPGGAKTVFVASGAGFADALAGGPAAAANGGPVLLVRPDAVPDAIAAELQRLKPTRIVVLGGEQAVSKPVFEKLRDFVK